MPFAMKFWKSTRSSSPPTSSSTTPQSCPSRSQRFFFWSSREHQQPRLSRQKKVRYSSDGGFDRRTGTSMPVSRTESTLDRSVLSERSESSSIVVPLPLPTPEGAAAAASPRGSDEFGFRRTPLPSIDGRKLKSLAEEPAWGQTIAHRRLSDKNNSRATEFCQVPIPLFDQRHSIHMLENSNARQNNFLLNFPPRSAPGSVLSSPVLSPRRTSMGEFSNVLFAPMSPQAWSPTEHPPSDFMSGFYRNHPMEHFTSSGSPLYSPKLRSPAIMSTNPSPPSSPMHQRLVASPPPSPMHQRLVASPPSSPMHQQLVASPPSSPMHQKMMHTPSPFHQKMIMESGGNNTINAHPLPRPPGSSLATPSFPATFVHQPLSKPEVSTTPSMSNQWEKGELIGAGAFGRVYIATNRLDGSTCAMKEVNMVQDDPKSAECIKQLQQEIRFLSKLKHPNIVQYYGSDIVNKDLYIYLEYVFPGSMQKYLRKRVITEHVVRNFTRHILNGLAYLHSENVMHRDIKGANLLVDSNGVVKLADFGMAKHLGELQTAQSLKGTSYWMAPEVLMASVKKEKSYDLAVDIWSLGCTVIEMFTGTHPWNGYEDGAAMFKILNSSPEIPQGLSPEGKDFLHLCFRRNPLERPTASDLLKHAFVTSSNQHEVNSSIQAFAGMKLSEPVHNGSMNNSSSSTSDQVMKSHLIKSGLANFLRESTDFASSRYSPPSMHEVMPNFPQCRNPVPSSDITISGSYGGSSRMRSTLGFPTSNHKDLLHL